MYSITQLFVTSPVLQTLCYKPSQWQKVLHHLSDERLFNAFKNERDQAAWVSLYVRVQTLKLSPQPHSLDALGLLN